MNGGMQRCFHILHQLSRHCKVTAIINQDETTFKKAIQFFPELGTVEIYSTKNEPKIADVFSLLPFKIKNALRYRWYKRSFSATTDSNLLLYYPVLKRLLKKERFDLVIIENLDTINAIDIIRRHAKNIPILYDAHNVDSRLAEEKVARGLLPKEYLRSIKQAESNLYKTVDGILACSEKDLSEFKQMNGQQLKGVVVPNGVYLEDKLFDEGVQTENPGYILFCGSLNYEPNAEGLNWFYHQIWPIVRKQFPALQLLVVGSGNLPKHLTYLTKDNSLYFTGTVEDVKPYYNKAAVAIVPLISGSGTRLKILEAMNFGVPVISTSKGAEGIDCIDNTNLIIADSEELFIRSVAELLYQKQKRIFLQQNARLLAEKKYDWTVIGKDMTNFIYKDLFKNVIKPAAGV